MTCVVAALFTNRVFKITSLICLLKHIGLEMVSLQPPDLRGTTFANFGPGGEVCEQMAKHVIYIYNLYHKYKKREMPASF